MKINDHIEVKSEGDKITIIVTPTQGVVSKSGKSLVVGSTNGFVSVGVYKLNLNLIKQN